MIPTIETIVEDLIAGKITKSQAVTWLHQHAENAHRDLRDYFAGKALQGILANEDERRDGRGTGLSTHEGCAMSAYHYADAMLAERSR